MPPKKKEVKLVDEPCAEPVVEAPAPPTFEEKLVGVWEAQDDLIEQRRLAAEFLELKDGPSHSLQAMTIDDALSHILLAKEAEMNVAQAKVLLEIMSSIKENLSDESLTMLDAYTAFKGKIMDNCDLRFLKSEKQLKEEEEARLIAEAAAAEAAAAMAEAEASKKGKKDAKKSGKGTEEEEHPKEVEPEKPFEGDPHFTQEQIRIISDYVTSGVFGHYKLHAAVFAPQFTSRKKIIEQAVCVETIIPDGLDLANAVEIIPEPGAEELAEQQAEETAQTIAALVAARINEAKSTYAAKLAENKAALDDRLKVYESKLSGKKK